MRVKVSKRGLVIPKTMLTGIEEVRIKKENGVIVISPVSKDDPMIRLGKSPVECGVPDASENHDRYIYGSQV